MLGLVFLPLRILRMAGSAQSGSGKSEPSPRPEPTPAGPFVVGAILAVLAAVAISTVRGHLVGPLMLALIPVIIGILILGGVFFSGVNEARGTIRSLRDLPSAPTADDEARKTALMRAQAAGFEFRGDTAVRTLPKPPQAHPDPARTLPRVMTRAQIREDAEDDARLLRIAAIIVQPCPFCGAGEGMLCMPVEGYKWYALDRARGVYAHPMRIAKAIGNRSAELEDVLAQFDGSLPEDIAVSLI